MRNITIRHQKVLATRVPSSDAWFAMSDHARTTKADIAKLKHIRDVVRKPQSFCREPDGAFPGMPANIDFNSQASRIVRDMSHQIEAMPHDIQQQTKNALQQAMTELQGPNGFDGLPTNVRSSDDRYFSQKPNGPSAPVAKQYQRARQDQFIEASEHLQKLMGNAVAAEIPTYLQACEDVLPRLNDALKNKEHPHLSPSFLRTIGGALKKETEAQINLLKAYRDGSVPMPGMNKLIRSFSAIEGILEIEDGRTPPD